MFNTSLAEILDKLMVLDGGSFIMHLIANALVFYGIAAVVIVVNMLFTTGVVYAILALYRAMGWTWIDGTNHGFFERY